MGELDLEGVRFRVKLETRRYGKTVTVLDIDGWPRDEIKALAHDLKSYFGTGGTSTESSVELQGDHQRRIRQYLADKGFPLDE